MHCMHLHYAANYPISMKAHCCHVCSLSTVQQMNADTKLATVLRLGCYVSKIFRPVVMHVTKEEMHTVHTTVISETLQINIFRFILQPAAH